MATSRWQKLDQAGRRATPGVLSLLLVLFGAAPLYAPYYGPVAPVLPLIAVYYWSVHRPDLMPFWLVFLIGLLQDILTAGPTGLWAMILLACQWLLMGQRRFVVGRPFLLIWLGFVAVAAMALTLEWLASSAYHVAVMPTEPALFRALLTIALFPALFWLFVLVHRGFVQAH